MPWLEAEARALAHRSHPAIPTTYDFLDTTPGATWGPGYLRRWVVGMRVADRAAPPHADDTFASALLRSIGSAVAHLHASGETHGTISPDVIWTAPSGQFWLLRWQWALPRSVVPDGALPLLDNGSWPPEWGDRWAPSAASDQWQLAATVWRVLTGTRFAGTAAMHAQAREHGVKSPFAELIERMVAPDPADRFPTVAAALRQLERIDARAHGSGADFTAPDDAMSAEDRIRRAVSDDYRVIAPLGAGTFGSVWRVRDLSLNREVALKVLHPEIARDVDAIDRFQREARLAAQLQHPGIVPVYDWDSRDGISWYTSELAEHGSLADRVARAGG
ncbi:MAG TPA: protein kinase, partial [Candidatus Elarobacter sp.]|nr:protein kinase [Candidatus Elarobacter sp.]